MSQETNPPQIIKFTRPVSANLTNAFEGGVKGLGTRIADPNDKRILVAQPVYIVDPEAAQNSGSSLDIASVVALDNSFGSNPALAAFASANAKMHRFLKVGSPNVFQYLADQGSFGISAVSGVHTAQNVILDLRQEASILAIDMTASGGTATLVVTAGVDGATFPMAIDSIAAALQTDLQYTLAYYTINGAGTANGGAGAGANKLNPLAFRWVKVAAGDAGVGNTTTLTIGVK